MLVGISLSLVQVQEDGLADSTATFTDKAACAELIQAWGVYRDQGRWKELRSTFTPDGHRIVSLVPSSRNGSPIGNPPKGWLWIIDATPLPRP